MKKAAASWRIVNSEDLLGQKLIGKTIAKKPDGGDQYEVKKIHEDGYITAFHSNGKTELKMFPDERLISDVWWIKK